MNNKSLIITDPDKGSGVIILDYQNYVNKIISIRKDSSKFVQLGSIDKFDST